MNDAIRALLHPQSIAVIGASSDFNKINGRTFKALVDKGYAGRILPVNPKYQTLLDRPCYPDIASIPGSVDLAVVAVPARHVPDTLRELGRKGVKAAVVFSSGFSEVGGDGIRLEAELKQAIRESGVRMLGPNCLGFMNVGQNIYATFSPVIKTGRAVRGPIALVSQSGAFGAYAYSLARGRGVGLSHWITTGNEAGLGVSDCIEWLIQDEHTRVIMVYIEGVREGERFKRALAGARAAGKLVVAVKVGRSELGAQAAASHTASLAGDDAAYEALFRQYGVWRAHGIDEFFQVAHALVVL